MMRYVLANRCSPRGSWTEINIHGLSELPASVPLVYGFRVITNRMHSVYLCPLPEGRSSYIAYFWGRVRVHN